MPVDSGRSYIATPDPVWLALAVAPGLAIVACLVLYPLGLAISYSLDFGAGGPSAEHYFAFFADGQSYRATLRTLGLALATTVVSLALSIPLGYVARLSPRLGTIIRILIALPLAVPVLIAGYALALFYSENGLFNSLLVRVLHIASEPLTISYTWTGLLVACVWRFFPYTGLLIVSALQSADRAVEEAAASAGANAWQTFWRVTLPMIAPAALTGGILTFVSTFGTFSLPLLMGRSAETLSVMAYRKVTGSFDWPAASTIVLVMAVIQIAVLVGIRRRVLRWVHRG
ncbi:MAG TPA: ABC transporter permease subunit [Stellaceae bacterium]|nr:ABC transporter permease subunit [Stellaceae bacterium]